MSQPPLPPASADELQFSTVESVSPQSNAQVSAQSCALCRQPISAIYYAVRDKILCPSCRGRLTATPQGSKIARLARATLMGVGAGLVGAMIWFIIRRAAHIEIGLVAILVGYMVGKAVRAGSRGLGGRGYQILAVVITYCCIAVNYMPDVVEAFVANMHKHETTANSTASSSSAAAASDGSNTSTTAKPPTNPVKLVLALGLFAAIIFGVSLAAPFRAGAQNLIGLLIIGFALWQAWKMNARRNLPISGPYQIGPAPVMPGSGVVA